MGIKDIAAVSSLICKTFAHPLEALSSIGPSLHELTFGHAGSSFTPERDIGDLVGKVVFVTGGNCLLLSTGNLSDSRQGGNITCCFGHELIP